MLKQLEELYQRMDGCIQCELGNLDVNKVKMRPKIGFESILIIS